MRIRRKIKLYNGLKYRDDRLFVCNLTFSEVKGVEVKNGMMKPTKKKNLKWTLVTYHNTIQLMTNRIDSFKNKETAIKYLQKVEPFTPLISRQGNPLEIPHQEDNWLYWRRWLKENKLFSALSEKQHVPFWVDSKGYNYAEKYHKQTLNN